VTHFAEDVFGVRTPLADLDPSADRLFLFFDHLVYIRSVRAQRVRACMRVPCLARGTLSALTVSKSGELSPIGLRFKIAVGG